MAENIGAVLRQEVMRQTVTDAIRESSRRQVAAEIGLDEKSLRNLEEGKPLSRTTITKIEDWSERRRTGRSMDVTEKAAAYDAIVAGVAAVLKAFRTEELRSCRDSGTDDKPEVGPAPMPAIQTPADNRAPTGRAAGREGGSRRPR